MIKYGVPYTDENGFKDDRLIKVDPDDCFSDSFKEAMQISKWIKDNILPSSSVNLRYTSYSLKHLLENDIHIYLTNNQFKHAMMLAGYMPEDPNELNWRYCIELVRDIKKENYNPFVQYLLQYETEDSPRGDFAKDVIYDSDFPAFSDHDCILGYLRSLGACSRAIDLFEETYKDFQFPRRI